MHYSALIMVEVNVGSLYSYIISQREDHRSCCKFIVGRFNRDFVRNRTRTFAILELLLVSRRSRHSRQRHLAVVKSCSLVIHREPPNNGHLIRQQRKTTTVPVYFIVSFYNGNSYTTEKSVGTEKFRYKEISPHRSVDRSPATLLYQ